MSSKKIGALTLLTDQHLEVQALLEKIVRTRAQDPEPLLHLAQLLALNITLKQRLLYPVLVAEGVDWPFDDVRQEQVQVRRTLSYVLCLEVGEPLFRAAVRGLKALLEHQFQEEEEALFPQVRATLNAARLAEMAAAMRALARQLSAAGGGKCNPPPRRLPGEAVARVLPICHAGGGQSASAGPGKRAGTRREGSSPLP